MYFIAGNFYSVSPYFNAISTASMNFSMSDLTLSPHITQIECAETKPNSRLGLNIFVDRVFEKVF